MPARTSSARRLRAASFAVVVVCAVLSSEARAANDRVGVELNLPVPARDVGDSQLGIGLGLTHTRMENPYVGAGFDVGYHYWPASAGYEAALDRYLRSSLFIAMDDVEWAFSAYHATGHLRLNAPIGRRASAWAQVGGGLYRVDRHLGAPNDEGAYAHIIGEPAYNVFYSFGGYGSAGFDVVSGERVYVGLHAEGHVIPSNDERMPRFVGGAVGLHVTRRW